MRAILLLFTCIVLAHAPSSLAADPSNPQVEKFIKALMPNALAAYFHPDDKPSLTLQLHFPLNSAELTPPTIQQLDDLGRALQHQSLKIYHYVVQGHTCDLGTKSYNLDLSRRRAQAVVNYLVQKYHLAPAQFTIQGYGDSQPLVPNTSEAQRAQNRRVVIINTLQEFKAFGLNDPPN